MKTYLTIIIGVSIFILSCKKDHTQPPTKPNDFNTTNYPLNVGNWWRFYVKDFYANIADTLIVKVVSTDIANPNKFNCLLTNSFGLVDSGMFELSSDKISYIGKGTNLSYFGSFVLKLPFNVGEKWNGVNSKDSITAISKIDTMNIFGKKFNPVYFIKRLFVMAGGYKLVQTIYIVPGIGVVQQSYDLFDGSPVQKQTFQLVDYKIN